MIEHWQIIEKYENYEVSNTGFVKNTKRGKILQPGINTHGYYMVNLSKNNQSKVHLVHRLVTQNFLENPLNLKNVDHIDGNRKNNRIENLRWCTVGQNNANKDKQSNNTSGIKGVHLHKHTNKWRAVIHINYKKYHLGLYNSKEEAGFLVEFFAKALFKEFARITREFNKFYTPELFEKILQIKTKHGFTF